MASSLMASVLDGSSEKINGFKLMRLIVDGGTEALRKLFLKYEPGNLQGVLSSHRTTLNKLRRRVISQGQWDKLYPAPPNQPDINDFDITLLCILLRNICCMPPPRTGWDDMPNATDNSEMANMIRIRTFRNTKFAHISNTSVSSADFLAHWDQVSAPLVALGISQEEIDRLKNDEYGKEEVSRVWKLWNESEVIVLQRLEEFGSTFNQKMDELLSHSDGTIDKQLACCDFRTEINFFNEKFVEGTREWIFREIAAWFDNETSNNRAFVVSAAAGMGKSVIAAVVCRQYAEYLSGCHFCQYNNDHYNNPKVLLQSLARQLSVGSPEYRKALTETISGNLGQGLNNMSIGGLFSVLFKEPLAKISPKGKRFLMVIDAVDEGEFNGRLALADLFATHLHKLPKCFRFLITTRPEKNIIDKFEKLNPLYIEMDDPRNLNDIERFFHDRHSAGWIQDLKSIEVLTEKCDGLMIYAFFLAEHCRNSSSVVSSDSLLAGIGDYYRICFERLEGNLKELKVDEDDFLNLLSVLAVAKEPLPRPFIEKVFGVDGTSPSKRRSVMNAIRSLSTLFIFGPSDTVCFCHKSVRDWLVTNLESVFAVDENSGHKILGEMCRDKLAEWKRNGGKISPMVRYCLKYSLKHMLSVPEDQQGLESFVKDFILDLEIMYASVCVDVDGTIENIACLKHHEMYSHFGEDIKELVKVFFLLVRKFSNILREYPQAFFQHLVNEGGGKLSSEASSLLQTRYKELYCLEFINKDKIRTPYETCCSLSGQIYSVDVSPEGRYLVCGYIEGGLELFSLQTGMSVWHLADFPISLRKLPHSGFSFPPRLLTHCIVFHPHLNIIFPGQLDQVVNFQGKFESGLVHCEEGEAKFTDCCFSKDNSRMVTTYEKNLFIWDILSSEKIRSVALEVPLVSMCFTANGMFLGTTDARNEFRVYVVAKSYYCYGKVYVSQHPVEIISNFQSDSWILVCNDILTIRKPDVSTSDVLPSVHPHQISDIVIPCNSDAGADLCRDLFSLHHSWFLTVKQLLNATFAWSGFLGLRFLAVGNELIIVFSCALNLLYVFSRNKLVNMKKRPNNNKGVITEISSHGDFVYTNSAWSMKFTALKRDSRRLFTKADYSTESLFFLTVRNGVFFIGKNDIPELWSSDLSQCMTSFDTLAPTTKCYSVSDELVACLCGDFLYFLNVFSCEVKSKIRVDKKDEEVRACSSKYHVFVVKRLDSSSILWKDGVRVDDWTNLFGNFIKSAYPVVFADFSPRGDFFAACCSDSFKIFTFDMNSLKLRSQVQMPRTRDFLRCKFFNDNLLLCSSPNHCLYLVNVVTGVVLTYVDVGDIPAPLSVCHEQNIVLAGRNCSEEYDLIKVWLPR